MRFADIRPTFIKGTPAAEGYSESAATPLLLSPYVNGDRNAGKLKPGVQMTDILQNTYNRAGRRRAGQVKSRKRLRDNKIQAHWLSVLKAQRAMERNLENASNG